MKRFNQSLLMLACVLLLAGCGPNAGGPIIINHKAQVRKLPDGGYEVLIPYRYIARRPLIMFGRLHFPFLDYAKSIDYTNWLYLAHTSGTVDASNVLVMTVKSSGVIKESPGVIKDMTGTVCFSNGMMTVNLTKPFRGGPYGVRTVSVPFYLNGTYQLE